MKNCPNCNAPLHDEAGFCPHCMTQLIEKEKIESNKKPKNKKKKIIIATISLTLVIVVIIGVLFSVNSKKHEPICSYAQFLVGATAVSHRMNIDDLWEIPSFTDTHGFEKQNIIQYNGKTNVDGAVLSLFFYNEGEEIYAYFSDVKPKEYTNAENILKCVTQTTCNYYFDDIDQVFDDESIYPKKTLDMPFDSFFTDLLNRTDEYNKFIANNGTITTKYIPMANNDIIIVYYVVERTEGNETIYDLAIDIERQ